MCFIACFCVLSPRSNVPWATRISRQDQWGQTRFIDPNATPLLRLDQSSLTRLIHLGHPVDDHIGQLAQHVAVGTTGSFGHVKGVISILDDVQLCAAAELSA